MSFTHPVLLLFIPAFVLLEAIIFYRIRSNSLNIPAIAFLQPRNTWRINVVRVMRFLTPAAVVFLLVALAGPRRVYVQQQVLPSGIDILVALDASGSMAAEDFQPLNRLQVAKDVLRDFIRGRPSDRIGLILFSGMSVTRSPLTLQHQPLLRTLSSVEMGFLPEGTAIGSAILSGINRLSVSSDKRGARILVLITDGRNNAGEVHPLDTISLLRRNGIKVYSIGVGSFDRVPFPVVGPDGKKTYRYEEADLDEALLARIAEESGGRYFRATDPKSLQNLFAQINRLEKSTPQVAEARVLETVAHWFSFPAAFLLMAYVLFSSFITRLP